MIQGPSVQIDPSIQHDVQDAVDELKKMDPGFFKGVGKIVGLSGGPFGQVESTDPTTIHINLPKIKSQVQSQMGSAYNSSDPAHKQAFQEAIKRAIVETISHEKGHISDYDPKQNKFPGGEGAAESNEQQVMQRLHFDKPIQITEGSLNKTAVLIQKVNKNTGKKEWALVSKKDHDKVLEWYGSSKPNKERVEKTEKRVQWFKHQAQVGNEPSMSGSGYTEYNLTGNDYLAGGPNAEPKETRLQELYRRHTSKCPPHSWDKDGERCTKCGDKDWMT